MIAWAWMVPLATLSWLQGKEKKGRVSSNFDSLYTR